jgi:hypothetical protein
MEDLQLVMLGAGCDENISSGCCNSRLTAGPRQFGGSFPDGRRSGHLLEIPLELA